MKTQMKADLMLLAVTVFWGLSYLFVVHAFKELEPFNLNAIRFIIAFVAAMLLMGRSLFPVNKITLKYAALLGAVLMVVYVGATFGVKYTSISNAGFLGALTVVITPILGFFFKGQRPERKLLISVILALAGIALLTLNEKLTPALGDILCILGAVSYAGHLLLTETAVQKENVNAFQLGVYQLGFCGVYQLFFSFLTETPRLPSSGQVWVSVLVLAIFCTGVAFVAQTLAQQYTSASHVGVIFSLEPLITALFAFFIAGEVLSQRAYFGAILLLFSFFVMELDLKKLVGHYWKVFIKDWIQEKSNKENL